MVTDTGLVKAGMAEKIKGLLVSADPLCQK